MQGYLVNLWTETCARFDIATVTLLDIAFARAFHVGAYFAKTKDFCQLEIANN